MNYQYRLVPVEALTAKVEAQRARLRQKVALAQTFQSGAKARRSPPVRARGLVGRMRPRTPRSRR